MTKRSTSNDYPRIYLFGDSLTERACYEGDNGFAWKLEQYYDGRVDVVNEGVYSCFYFLFYFSFLKERIVLFM